MSSGEYKKIKKFLHTWIQWPDPPTHKHVYAATYSTPLLTCPPTVGQAQSPESGPARESWSPWAPITSHIPVQNSPRLKERIFSAQLWQAPIPSLNLQPQATCTFGILLELTLTSFFTHPSYKFFLSIYHVPGLHSTWRSMINNAGHNRPCETYILIGKTSSMLSEQSTQ